MGKLALRNNTLGKKLMESLANQGWGSRNGLSGAGNKEKCFSLLFIITMHQQLSTMVVVNYFSTWISFDGLNWKQLLQLQLSFANLPISVSWAKVHCLPFIKYCFLRQCAFRQSPFIQRNIERCKFNLHILISCGGSHQLRIFPTEFWCSSFI